MEQISKEEKEQDQKIFRELSLKTVASNGNQNVEEPDNWDEDVLKIIGNIKRNKENEENKGIRLHAKNMYDFLDMTQEIFDNLYYFSVDKWSKKADDFKKGNIESAVKEAMNLGISHEEILKAIFEFNLQGTDFKKTTIYRDLFTKNFNDKEKEVLHKAKYERNMGWLSKGFRSGITYAAVTLASAMIVPSALAGATGFTAGLLTLAAAGLIGASVNSLMKLRFKENRTLKAWLPENWEVKDFASNFVSYALLSLVFKIGAGIVC